MLRARAEQGVTLVQTTWACECLGGSTWGDVMQQSVALSGQVTSDMQRLRWTLMHYSVMPMMHAIAWAGWCRPPCLHNSENYSNFWHGGGAPKLRSTTTAHNHATRISPPPLTHIRTPLPASSPAILSFSLLQTSNSSHKLTHFRPWLRKGF